MSFAQLLAARPEFSNLSEFHCKAEEVISKFIRTAVLIDDDWPSTFESIQENPENSSSITDPDEKESTLENESDLIDNEELDDGNSYIKTAPTFSSKSASPTSGRNSNRLLKIQKDFVERGIIFTGFKFKAKDKDVAESLAKNSDILILDWDFAGDEGAGATGILKSLSLDGQLRFVCIFTDQPDLVNIKNSILECLSDTTEILNPDLSFKASNFVITIKNKSSEPIDLPEKTLFHDAIHNLAKHYNGFLQLGMLEMSSQHRSTMMTHLTRFSSKFDSALLAEAAQSGSPIDIGTNLRAMLVDEWRVALESAFIQNKNSVLDTGRKLYAAHLKSHTENVTKEFLEKCLRSSGLDIKPAIVDNLFLENEDGIRNFDKAVNDWLENGASTPDFDS